MVQRHRPIGTTGWFTSHTAAISSSLIEGDDYHANDCNGDNDNEQQQRSRHPSFSRRKVISTTIAGMYYSHNNEWRCHTLTQTCIR